MTKKTWNFFGLFDFVPASGKSQTCEKVFNGKACTSTGCSIKRFLFKHVALKKSPFGTRMPCCFCQLVQVPYGTTRFCWLKDQINREDDTLRIGMGTGWWTFPKVLASETKWDQNIDGDVLKERALVFERFCGYVLCCPWVLSFLSIYVSPFPFPLQNGWGRAIYKPNFLVILGVWDMAPGPYHFVETVIFFRASFAPKPFCRENSW